MRSYIIFLWYVFCLNRQIQTYQLKLIELLSWKTKSQPKNIVLFDHVVSINSTELKRLIVFPSYENEIKLYHHVKHIVSIWQWQQQHNNSIVNFNDVAIATTEMCTATRLWPSPYAHDKFIATIQLHFLTWDFPPFDKSKWCRYIRSDL